MNRYQCKCGQSYEFGSEPPGPCYSCDNCGTTLVAVGEERGEVYVHLWRGEVMRLGKYVYRQCSRCSTLEAIQDPLQVTRRFLFEVAVCNHTARHDKFQKPVTPFWQCTQALCTAIANHLEISGEAPDIEPGDIFGGQEQWQNVLGNIGAQVRKESEVAGTREMGTAGG